MPTEIAHPYEIYITGLDMDTFTHIGGRYAWSEWCETNLCEGRNFLREHEAWEFRDACEEDMEGGHSPFPMLNSECDLYYKLETLLESIV